MSAVDEGCVKLLFDLDYPLTEVQKVALKANPSFEDWLCLWLVQRVVLEGRAQPSFANEASEPSGKTIVLAKLEEALGEQAKQESRPLASVFAGQCAIGGSEVEAFLAQISTQAGSFCLSNLAAAYPAMKEFVENGEVRWGRVAEQVVNDLEAAYQIVAKEGKERQQILCQVKWQDLPNGLKVAWTTKPKDWLEEELYKNGAQVVVFFNNFKPGCFVVEIKRNPRFGQMRSQMSLIPVVKRLRFEEARVRGDRLDQREAGLSGWVKYWDFSNEVITSATGDTFTKLTIPQVVLFVGQGLSVYGPAQVQKWLRS